MVILISLQAICSAYHPVFEYDVPVASQPIVYASPAVHGPGHYYGSYAVHTSPAVSHTFTQTQTHPVSYVKPVCIDINLMVIFSFIKKINCKIKMIFLIDYCFRANIS